MNSTSQTWQTIAAPPEQLLWNGRPTLYDMLYRSCLIIFILGLFASYVAYKFLAADSVEEACRPNFRQKCETIYYLRWVFFGVPVWCIALLVGEYLGQLSGPYARDYAITSERAIVRHTGVRRSIKSVKLGPNVIFKEAFGNLLFGNPKKPTLIFSCLSNTDRSAAADACKIAALP